jgi:hypothetical protein
MFKIIDNYSNVEKLPVMKPRSYTSSLVMKGSLLDHWSLTWSSSDENEYCGMHAVIMKWIENVNGFYLEVKMPKYWMFLLSVYTSFKFKRSQIQISAWRRTTWLRFFNLSWSIQADDTIEPYVRPQQLSYPTWYIIHLPNHLTQHNLSYW